jgi:ABC-type sugar transport system substrate-binding protein
MMRRILVLVTVVLVMAAMMLASAVPALAQNCVVEIATSQVGPGHQGNALGQAVSEEAKAEGGQFGQETSVNAQQESCAS